MQNTQITFDQSPDNARSESVVAINPNNPLQMVASSKKFTNMKTYEFTIGISYSWDGGKRWYPGVGLGTNGDLQLPNGFTHLSDPALTWDDSNNVILVALPWDNTPPHVVGGIAVYKSTDGGRTWGSPNLIHNNVNDDKQWVAADQNGAFPGHVYAVWMSGQGVRFARSVNNGNTWKGVANSPAGTILKGYGFSPEINVANDGTIYIVWRVGNNIEIMKSTDGGESFSAAQVAVSNIQPLETHLPSLGTTDPRHVFPGGTFRVTTCHTACAGPGNLVVIAWPDFREGVSRIYYAASEDGGATWGALGSGISIPNTFTGSPVLNTPNLDKDLQHFMPQVVCDPFGTISCAFYEFGQKPSTYKIDVLVAQSFIEKQGLPWAPINIRRAFSSPLTLTDSPWDPAIDAPLSHGDPGVTFIGEYFGLDASSIGAYSVWTDTRTGIQELWGQMLPNTVPVKHRYEEVANILFGILNDGGGIEVVGGHVRPIPPRGPLVEILVGIACFRMAELSDSKEAEEVRQASMKLVERIAKQEKSVLLKSRKK